MEDSQECGHEILGLIGELCGLPRLSLKKQRVHMRTWSRAISSFACLFLRWRSLRAAAGAQRERERESEGGELS